MNAIKALGSVMWGFALFTVGSALMAVVIILMIIGATYFEIKKAITRP